MINRACFGISAVPKTCPWESRAVVCTSHPHRKDHALAAVAGLDGVVLETEEPGPLGHEQPPRSGRG
jgi:hypothetical protein